jgi:hypothetical protein
MTGIPVEILYSEGCARRQAARDAVYLAAEASGVVVDLTETLVTDQAMAERLRVPGSPTVRVRGRDVQPEAERQQDYGLG